MPGDTARSVRGTVERFLRQQSFPSEARLLVAISGGQDSVCLLDALASTLPAAGARIIVVHVDHRLRGPDSAADARLVSNLAARLGCEAFTVQVDVAAYAQRHALSLEEAGRYIRYQTLAGAAVREGAWGAATGHTLDDLAETLLINLVRGTGPLGITSIQPIQTYTLQDLGPCSLDAAREMRPEMSLRVIRPLLDLTREETEQYCAETGLEFRRDLSNLDIAFLRNRIRHHLIPLLRTYNPSIVEALGRLARLATDDEAELERSVRTVWQVSAGVSPGKVSFSWRDWSTHSAAIQRRLLRRARRQLSGVGAWSFESLEGARLLLAGRPTRRRLSLGGEIELTTTRDGFQLTRSKRHRPTTDD